MIEKGMTIQDAAHRWVNQFNAIPQGMIEKLMRYDRMDWHEVTLPSRYDRVRVSKLPKGCASTEHDGELVSLLRSSDIYCIRLDDGTAIEVGERDFTVLHDDKLPMCGTLWSFGERMDDDWLEGPGGLQAMSDCGFRVFESDEFGYFFGIDGAGYDFYSQHWIPLYKARGLEWHDPATLKEAS